MEVPVTVTSIEWDGDADPITPDRLFGGKAGSWVSVRPVGDNKTYLGILLGDYKPPAVSFDPKTGILTVGKSIGNPAMWVPDLCRVIMGWGSWWGVLSSPTDLHQITDADIQNIWYVKALKELEESANNQSVSS